MLAIHAVDKAHDNENSEGDNKEIDDVLDEIAVGDMGNGVGAEDIGNVDGEVGEIETASEEASDRHNHIIDKGIDDGGKGATNGDTDGEIDDTTAINEFPKFFHERAFGDFFDRGG